MKVRLCRFLEIFWAITLVFAFAAALAIMAAGCKGDDDDEQDGGADAGAVGGDGGQVPPPPSSGSGGSGGTGGSAQREDAGEMESSGGSGPDPGGTDAGPEGPQETVDAGDSEPSSDAGGGETPADAGGGETPADAGDADGASGGLRLCTEDDLSNCIDISGGLAPYELCCTPDGRCGNIFDLGQGVLTDCMTDQLPDSLVTEQCEDCAAANCPQEYSDCSADGDCDALNDCLKTCTDLMTCVQCGVDHPDSVMPYGALASCALAACPTCSDELVSLLPPEAAAPPGP